MKLDFDLKKEKYKVDVDAEKLIEKGMDQHNKNWKEKLELKHKSKKELMELKHKQKLESKDQGLKKKSFVKEIFDGINTNKKIELEEKRKAKEEKKQLGIILLIGGTIIALIGFGLNSYGPGQVMIGFMGFIGNIAGIVLLLKSSR